MRFLFSRWRIRGTFTTAASLDSSAKLQQYCVSPTSCSSLVRHLAKIHHFVGPIWKKYFKQFLFALRAERVHPLTHVSVSLRLRKYKLAARSCEPGARPRLGSPPWSYVETICNLTFPRGPHRNHAPGTEIQEERPPPPTPSSAQVSRNTSAELTLNDG